MSHWRELDKGEQRRRLGSAEGWLSILVNALLALVKLLAGLYTGSLAILSDAVHSLSDCLTSVVVIVGFHFSHRAADRRHPFGHGRAEAISTLIIAILLILAGFELGRSSLLRILKPSTVEFSWIVLVILIITLLVKEWLARFSEKLGKLLGSGALKADAWHHRLDALSTGVVVLALVLQYWHLPYVDGVAGMLVSAMVIWSGFGIASETFDDLLGRSPDPQQIERLSKLVKQVPGAANVHEILVHDYGLNTFISMDIEVASELSLIEAHEIAEKVSELVSREFNAQVSVHVDPVDYRDPLRARLKKELQSLLVDCCDLDAHDIYVSQENGQNCAGFTLLFSPAIPKPQREERASQLRLELLARIDELQDLQINLRKRRHS